MKLRYAACAALIVLGATSAWAGVPTPIGTLHCNDANGVALLAGQTFTVQGIVTANQPTGTNSRFYVQDATGGINVFGAPQYCGNPGDEVEVTGTLAQFNGLNELSTPGLAITVLTTGNPIPAPLALTQPNDVAFSYDSGTNCEPNESRYVEVPNVYIRNSSGGIATGAFTANTNYRIITTGADSTTNFATFRVVQSTNDCQITNSLVGMIIRPDCPATVRGVIAQFDSSSPFTLGYQLTPTGAGDVVFDCATPTRASTCGRVKTLYR